MDYTFKYQNESNKANKYDWNISKLCEGAFIGFLEHIPYDASSDVSNSSEPKLY